MTCPRLWPFTVLSKIGESRIDSDLFGRLVHFTGWCHLCQLQLRPIRSGLTNTLQLNSRRTEAG